MGTLLDEWLAGLDSTPVLDEASVVLLRKRVRSEAAALGLSDPALGSIVSVASELAHNQLAHARGGRFAMRPIERAGVRGLEIIAADRGPGIASPTQAIKGRAAYEPSASAKKSLGVGLAAALELADELDLDVRIGEGTCIWARKFAEAVPRRKRVGVYGRPFPGEDESGDHGGFVRSADDVLAGVVDGLGHGKPAREASSTAIEALRQHSHQDIDGIVQSCHDAMQGTRGGVLALARVGELDPLMRATIVGDANLQVEGPGRHLRVGGRAFVLGARGQRPKPVVEEIPLVLRDVVLLFTDGISLRADLQQELDLLREHPIVIAHQLVERFSRNNDDALVLAVA
jgi:anti-sigma regulatory factor (Ser/Thr protein kinase)